MKFLSIITLVIASMTVSGCLNTYNTTQAPGSVAEEDVKGNGKEVVTADGKQTVININGGMQQQPAQPMVTMSYQSVYMTEYTPNGPVVRKALVPVYSTTPMCAPMVAPMPCLPQPQIIQPCQPQVIPAPSVQPTVTQPVAWFGPSSAPNYSTQTNWF